MKLIDTHAHLGFQAFDNDWMDVQRRAIQSGVGVINVGTQLATSQKSIHIAEIFRGQSVWAAIGQHPIHAIRHSFDPAAYRVLAERPEVVAIGEVGLDFFRMKTTYDDPSEGAAPAQSAARVEQLSSDEVKERQAHLFGEFISISRDAGKPLIIHVRDEPGQFDAYEEVAAILRRLGAGSGVAHCFGGDWQHARQFLDLGFSLGITGIVTFPKSDLLREVVKNTPLENLMIETDSPYLAPAPHRGKRNVPSNVQLIAVRIAELKNLPVDHVQAVTTDSAIRLFSLRPGS